MSQVLNAQELAEEPHGLSDLPVVIAGIEGDEDSPLIRIGVAGACTHDIEAIAAAMLSACKDALETLALSTPCCHVQLARVTASLKALKPLASAAPAGEVH